MKEIYKKRFDKITELIEEHFNDGEILFDYGLCEVYMTSYKTYKTLKIEYKLLFYVISITRDNTYVRIPIWNKRYFKARKIYNKIRDKYIKDEIDKINNIKYYHENIADKTLGIKDDKNDF